MAAARPAPGDDAALTFAARWAADVRPLLDCVDRVRPYLAGENIELPAIVVVGDQSSGKSSVLESISGIALPRGTNIVTRCPLELQLRRDTETYAIISRPAAVGLFGGDPSKMISERLARLEDIGPAIERFTAEIAGANKGVSDRPISLRVHRPDAPDLTLIDLPGAWRAARRTLVRLRAAAWEGQHSRARCAQERARVRRHRRRMPAVVS
jgi:interferon-induced GTP-binding protein Mx1